MLVFDVPSCKVLSEQDTEEALSPNFLWPFFARSQHIAKTPSWNASLESQSAFMCEISHSYLIPVPILKMRCDRGLQFILIVIMMAL